QALPLLAPKLRAGPVPDPARIGRLIAALDSEAFEQREAASRELAALGKLAERDLKRALSGKPSAEMKRRIRELFDEHHIADHLPRDLRRAAGGVRVLELLGTPEARRVLEEAARGPAGAWLTEEAKEALRRLGSDMP